MAADRELVDWLQAQLSQRSRLHQLVWEVRTGQRELKDENGKAIVTALDIKSGKAIATALKIPVQTYYRITHEIRELLATRIEAALL